MKKKSVPLTLDSATKKESKKQTSENVDRPKSCSLTITGENISQKQTQSICKISYDQFMEIHKTTENDSTHTSMRYGKWKIADNDLDLFYELYCNKLKYNYEPMHITEKPLSNYGPIKIDFDLKYKDKTDHSHIDDTTISKIVTNITNLIKESFDETENYLCIVTRRKQPYLDGNSGMYKDGLHLFYPYIVTTFDFQFALRLRYIDVMEDDISDVPYVIVETIKKQLEIIYDNSVIKTNNWLLYMSSKPKLCPYVIYKIYNGTLDFDYNDEEKLVNIVKLMSIRNKHMLSNKSLNYDKIMLSNSQIIHPNEKIKSKQTNKTKNVDINQYNEEENNDLVTSDCSDDVDKIKKLLDLLSNERNDIFSEWIKIGFIFHNLQKMSNSIDWLSIWKEWSEKSINYQEGCCEKFWKSMKYKPKGLTIATLYHYAKMDNEIEYYKIIKAYPTKTIVNIIGEGQKSCAEYYCKENKGNIIFGITNIYCWDNITNLWKKCDIDYICYKISGFIDLQFKELIKKELDHKNKNNHEYIAKLGNLLKTHVSYYYASNVAKYCKSILKNDEFENQMDDCRYVLNFSNGIYDLKSGVFRERKKDDYISKCLPFEYTETINETIKKEINNIIYQISNNDDELCKFNLSWLGYCLTGETRAQKFLMMIGYTAQNGKSTLAKLFMNSLPIYSQKIDKQTFNINFTKAHKQFVKVKKPVRFVCIEELDRNKLDVDRLKDFVDGDKIGGNEIMFGTSEDIKLHCKLHCTSNKDPLFDTDEGMKRRGLLEILTNKFVDKKIYDNTTNKTGLYLKDDTLGIKFDTNDEYKMAFISILLPYAKKYYANGLIIPAKVEIGFKDLCDDNDQMKNFIDEYYDITGNNEDKIHRDDFIDLYNIHYNTKFNWIKLSGDVKRLLTYDSQKRVNNRKGVIIGIKKLEIKNQLDNYEL